MKYIFLFFYIIISIVFIDNSSAADLKNISQSRLIVDMNNNTIFEQNANIPRPIASITKLMLALVASGQPLDEMLSIPSKRTVNSVIPKTVSKLSRKNIMSLVLIKSDNLAAKVLCDNLPDCIVSMNNMAKSLQMFDTHFEDPTGLDNRNISTAHDLAKLAIELSNNNIVSSLSIMPEADLDNLSGIIKIKNTNPLVAKHHTELSKTGFTNPAGGCLIMIVNTAQGKRAIVVLGSKNTHTRITDMEKLISSM